MSLKNIHSIGPANGQVTVKTYVGGLGAKIGHDLVLEATRWEGCLTVDGADAGRASVQVAVEASSLAVVTAIGGLKPLSDKDKADIGANQAKTLQTDKFPRITFASTAVSGVPPSLFLEGDLTVAGTTRPVILAIELEEGTADTTVTAKTNFRQTDFGIKPYSKFGLLTVKDEVDLQIVITIPSA